MKINDELTDNLDGALAHVDGLLLNLRDILRNSNGALTVVTTQLIKQAVKIKQTLQQINI